MKLWYLTASLCIIHLIYGTAGQRLLERLPGRFEASMDIRTNQLAQGLRSSAVSDAVNSAVSKVENALSSQASVNRRAFNAGIDRVAVASTEAAGPELLTAKKSLEIGQAGEAFLQAATGTARTLRTSARQLGAAFSRARIVPPRFPPRLLCPYDRSKWPTCTASDKYRTIDGSCNNLQNRLWGRASTPFERFVQPMYEDGVSSPRSMTIANRLLPGPRLVSYTFHLPLSRRSPDLTHLAMEFGQFLSHDIQFNALSRGYMGSRLDCCANRNRHGCNPINIPPNDPFFTNRTCMNMVRSLPTPNLDCTLGVREQLNQNTHYIDASQVYGSDKETADSLRDFTGGTLKTSGDLLPKKSGTNAGCIITNQARPCFRAGDPRVNQQPGLISFHTIMVKEHNRIAARLEELQPSWNDEKLYQESRRIVIAMLQHMTYKEYLPFILGNNAMTKYGLKPRTNGFYSGYSIRTKGIIRNGFMTAAFRFGHSMIYHKLPTHSRFARTSNNDLKDVFLKPDLVYTHGVDQITRGLTKSPSENTDRYVTPQVTRHLFERQPGFGADLAAININRGRDHGIPNYQVWRKYCGFRNQYSHTNIVRRALEDIYEDPSDMDLFTAGVSETPVDGGEVGPTFACLIGKQFRSLKKGDRFFYENSGQAGSFTQEQLRQIRRISMSKLICRNTGIDRIQRNAFKRAMPGNPLVGCRYITDIDLTAWGSGCVPRNGGYSAWRSTPCYGNFLIRYRICNNPAPNSCGTPCRQPFEIRVQFCRPWFNLPRWHNRSRFNRGRVSNRRRWSNRRRMGSEPRRSRLLAKSPRAVPVQTNADISSKVKAAVARNKNINSAAFEKALSAAIGNLSPTVQ